MHPYPAFPVDPQVDLALVQEGSQNHPEEEVELLQTYLPPEQGLISALALQGSESDKPIQSGKRC